MTSQRTCNSQPTSDWILPAAIPFADLKRRDLEECVYWLLDAMGAKDLEWRTGGTGGGAADGGRDLEARFYTPTADGELEAQKWWIECKGRDGTVEPDEVKSALNNAMAVEGLDYIVVATNTQFSNPTRDWVRQWQTTHATPKVKLWDHTHLERYLSRHPDVVLRLFSEALSNEGRFKAMEVRFWNKLEFVTPKTLADLWESRSDIDATAMGTFAAIANEFAHGSMVTRPWAGALGAEALLEVLSVAFQNVFYLAVRCSDAGISQAVIFRPLAYLALAALQVLPAEQVTELIMHWITRGKQDTMIESTQDMLITPILDQLQSEIQDVCASDCKRMFCFDRKALGQDQDQVKDYWMRLEPDGLTKPEVRRFLRIEKSDEPCVVGFAVDKDHGCPLFALTPSIKHAGELMAVMQRVSAFRRPQSAKLRKAE